MITAQSSISSNGIQGIAVDGLEFGTEGKFNRP
jgi:hypothetical protein